MLFYYFFNLSSQWLHASRHFYHVDITLSLKWLWIARDHNKLIKFFVLYFKLDLFNDKYVPIFITCYMPYWSQRDSKASAWRLFCVGLPLYRHPWGAAILSPTSQSCPASGHAQKSYTVTHIDLSVSRLGYEQCSSRATRHRGAGRAWRVFDAWTMTSKMEWLEFR